MPHGNEDEREDELETRVRRPASSPSQGKTEAPQNTPPPAPPEQPAIRPWMPAPADEEPRAASTRVTPPPPDVPPASPRAVASPAPTEITLRPRYTAEAGDDYQSDRAAYGAYANQETRDLARPRPASNSACIWVAGLILVIVAACGLLTYGAITQGFRGLGGMFPSVPNLPLITPTTIVDVSRPSVIEQIRPLGRLESSQYTIEKVITGESTGALPIFTSDKILFVAHGEVIAGVDLTKISGADVQVVSDTVTITLPPAEILVSRLDNDKSYVYNRETGIFTKADPNLESTVRQKAESEIVKAAIEGGILDTAQRNAEQTLRTLILALGYEEVIFKTRGVPVTPTPKP